jgi:hypothetical protein
LAGVGLSDALAVPLQAFVRKNRLLLERHR